MPRRPEDPAGAAGRSVASGFPPPPRLVLFCPGAPGRAGGCFPRDPPLPPCRGLFGLCRPRGWGEARQQPGGVGVPGGLRWPRCPGQKASGAGGGGGVPAARRGWDGGPGRLVVPLGRARGDAQGRQRRPAALLPALAMEGARLASPAMCDPRRVGPWHTGRLVTGRSRTLTPTTSVPRDRFV